MTGPTGNLGVGSLQGKARVSFMHESLGCPRTRRFVATLALGLSSLLELPAVYVLMAGRTLRWRGTIAPDLLACDLIERLFNVTMFTWYLSMGPDEGKASLLLMIIGTKLERRAI